MARAVGALTLTVVLLLAACGSAAHRSSTGSPLPTTPTTALAFDVPWIDRPATQPAPAIPAPSTLPPADARPCAANDVSIGTEEVDGASGTEQHSFPFKNVANSTCELGGYPSRVVGIATDHRTLGAENGTIFPADQAPGNIAPGEAAYFTVETFNQCHDVTPRPRPMTGAIVVTMPGGGDVTLPGTFDLTCGLHSGKFGVPLPPPVYPPKWFLGLTASLTVPDVVDAGATLTYVMTLHNTTTHTIRIVECPGYAEGVFGSHIEVTAFYALNCDRVHAVPASGLVRYEMRLRIPADTPTGDVSLQWMTTSDAEAPTARAALRVRGSH
ncbi:MAG: hypothetical protein QOI44_1840 [Actinomycetota bacterium]|nr:hypothetical protein [Actinomycetota bacterium]